MRFTLALLLIAFLINSCSQTVYSNEVKFTVSNHTSNLIDSILVQPDRSQGKLQFSLAPKESKEISINLSGLGDGAYGITYKIGTIHKYGVFGYFSNGIALEKLHKILIEADTVVYKTN